MVATILNSGERAGAQPETTFALIMRSAVDRLDLNLSTFARRLGWPGSTLRNYLDGRWPRLDDLRRAALRRVGGDWALPTDALVAILAFLGAGRAVVRPVTDVQLPADTGLGDLLAGKAEAIEQLSASLRNTIARASDGRLDSGEAAALHCELTSVYRTLDELSAITTHCAARSCGRQVGGRQVGGTARRRG